MKKPTLIQQIENQIQSELTQLPQPADLSQAARHKNNLTYVLDDNGKLLALNVTEAEGLREVTFGKDAAALQYLVLAQNKNLAQVTFQTPMPNLKYLDLSECCLTKLSFPAGFQALEKAYLQKNKLQQVAFADACPSLLFLDLSENELTEFSLPTGFDQLAYLYLNRNRLASLRFPACLPALDTLHLQANALKDFPEALLLGLPALKSLYLKENPLPEALRGSVEESTGNSCVAFLEVWFRDLNKGGTPDNECKVLLIGNGSVGKSCLVERLVNDCFLENWESTHAIVLKQFPHPPYLLNLWDFAGQDIYHATHRLFMQTGAVYLALWDWQTEHRTHTGYRHQGEERQFKNEPLSYWLDYARHVGKDCPVVVVQTKIGRDNKQDLPELRKAYRGKLTFLDFCHIESSLDDWDENGLDDLLRLVSRSVRRIKNVAPIPQNWVDLRQALRDLQVKGEKRLSIADYLTLPQAAALEADPLEVLQNWLVKTGVVFYRKGLFHDEIILDQAWAIRAIYTLFDREELFFHAVQRNKGRFSGKDLAKAWAQNAEEERSLFLGFMLACELCFEITEKDDAAARPNPSFEERQFAAPQLLDEAKPNAVADAWLGRQGLHLRYRHEFLHYGILQSFIVRTQSLAEMRDIWRFGISLKDGGNLALVEAPENTIHVVVTEQGKALLHKIRNLLEKLQDSRGTESVSLDGERFVLLEKLKNHPQDLPKIETETPGVWVEYLPLTVFLERDERASFEEEAAAENTLTGKPGEVERGILSFRKSALQPPPLPPMKPLPRQKTEVQPASEKTKILFLAANPTDQSRLQTDTEYRRLRAELLRGSQKDRFEFLHPQIAVTINELVRAMNDQPHIIHFSGHGERNGIAITNEQNETQMMPVEALMRLFRPLQGITNIVVLNACHTAEQASAISRYGIFVVGNNLPIGDPAAISFSEGFYNGIGEGKDFEASFNDGMAVVLTKNLNAASVIEAWKDGVKLDI